MAAGRKKGSIKIGGRKLGTPNRFNFLLEQMLKREGFNYRKELVETLRKVKENPDKQVNLTYLEVLYRMMPYVCFDVSKADLKKIEELINKSDIKKEVEKKVKRDELNNLLILGKVNNGNGGT